VPFQTQKWPTDLAVAIGQAIAERGSGRDIWRRVNAGTFGDWPAAAMPYSTVCHYGAKERKRRAVNRARTAARRPTETVQAKTDALAHRLLTLAERRLDSWEDTEAWTGDDLKDLAEVLVKLGRLATDRPAVAKRPKTPADPLVGLLDPATTTGPTVTARPIDTLSDPERAATMTAERTSHDKREEPNDRSGNAKPDACVSNDLAVADLFGRSA
jgi:hypothetical protein